jgi:hypothetical protein
MHETLDDKFQEEVHGDVFTTHMWLATKAYTVEKCEYHLGVIKLQAMLLIFSKIITNNYGAEVSFFN